MQGPFTSESGLQSLSACVFSVYFPRQTWCIFPKSLFFVLKKKKKKRKVFSGELHVMSSVRLRTKNNLNVKVIKN